MAEDRERRAYEILAELQIADRIPPDVAEDLAELGNDALPALREALELRNPDIRRVAATATARIASPSTLPLLLPLLTATDDDALREARPAIVRGIGQAAGTLRKALASRKATPPDDGPPPSSPTSPTPPLDSADPSAEAAEIEAAHDEGATAEVPGDAAQEVSAASEPSESHGEKAARPPVPEDDAAESASRDNLEEGGESDQVATQADETDEADEADEADDTGSAEPEPSESRGEQADDGSPESRSASSRSATLQTLLDRAVAALERTSGDPSPFVRAAVADAIGAFGDLRLKDTLIRLGGDADGFVCERSREALMTLAGSGQSPAASPGQPARDSGADVSAPRTPVPPGGWDASAVPGSVTPVPAILAALTAPDPRVRRRAQEELSRHPECVGVVLRYMGSSHTALRRAILEMLGEFEVPGVVDRVAMLLDAAWPERDDLILLLRAAARQRLTEPAFVDRQVRRFLFHQDVFLRAELAGLVAACHGPVLDVLPRLLRDREFHVRDNAARQWLRRADRHRARIIPDVLDLITDVLDQPKLYREDVMLLAQLFAGLRRSVRDGAFVEERAGTLTARALASPFPPLRRRAAELIDELTDVGMITDPAAWVRLDVLLLSSDAEEVALGLRLLERSHPASLERHMPGIVRYLYRADDEALARLLPALGQVRSVDAREAVRRVAQSHPSDELRALAGRALGSGDGVPGREGGSA